MHNKSRKWWMIAAIAVGMAALILTGKADGGRKEQTEEPVQMEGTAEEELPVSEAAPVPEPQIVDIMIFAGQSNMAGNGDASLAPAVPEGYGYEFRAVSDPTRLYPIEEPFGIEENLEGGIYDIWSDSGIRRKLGGLVPAFVNSYYETTSVPVIGVSASEGGTTIDQWQPGTGRFNDLKERAKKAQEYIKEAEDYSLRNTYLVWCQGESDGDKGLSEDAYYQAFDKMTTALITEDVIDKCMVIRIGNFGSTPTKYDRIMAAQTRYCLEKEDAILISTRFAEMADTGMMADVYHYTQEGYNLVGEEAGYNCGLYANTGEEPKIWDYETFEFLNSVE